MTNPTQRHVLTFDKADGGVVIVFADEVNGAYTNDGKLVLRTSSHVHHILDTPENRRLVQNAMAGTLDCPEPMIVGRKYRDMYGVIWTLNSKYGKGCWNEGIGGDWGSWELAVQNCGLELVEEPEPVYFEVALAHMRKGGKAHRKGALSESVHLGFKDGRLMWSDGRLYCFFTEDACEPYWVLV